MHDDDDGGGGGGGGTRIVGTHYVEEHVRSRLGRARASSTPRRVSSNDLRSKPTSQPSRPKDNVVKGAALSLSYRLPRVSSFFINVLLILSDMYASFWSLHFAD